MTLLNVLGDIKKVFVWLGSPRGQAVVHTGEAVAEAFGAPAAIINIADGWLTEIIKTEAIATAAGQPTGSGAQKSAMVLNAVTPEVLAFAQQHGLNAPNAEQIQKANDALVAFLNAFQTVQASA